MLSFWTADLSAPSSRRVWGGGIAEPPQGSFSRVTRMGTQEEAKGWLEVREESPLGVGGEG